MHESSSTPCAHDELEEDAAVAGADREAGDGAEQDPVEEEHDAAPSAEHDPAANATNVTWMLFVKMWREIPDSSSRESPTFDPCGRGSRHRLVRPGNEPCGRARIAGRPGARDERRADEDRDREEQGTGRESTSRQ